MSTACGPAEPEETYRDGNATKHGRYESFLRSDVAIFVELGLLYETKVGKERAQRYEGSDEDTKIGQTKDAFAEAVHVEEYNGKGFKPDVQQAVDEGNVQATRAVSIVA